MSTEKWKVTFCISRQKGSEQRTFQNFDLEVDPDEYVLDGVERIWAFHDRSLAFRHACHHSTCGACAMLVNSVEKLTCITPIRSVTHNGGVIKIEPLRNFPVVSDLVVDMSRFYQHMEEVRFDQVAPVEKCSLPYEDQPLKNLEEDQERLVDCIECGSCISACPVALTTPAYLGPAVLAGAQHTLSVLDQNRCVLDFIDSENGVWRCHSGFECTEVCPSNVDPAWRIMDMRRRVIANRIKRLFGRK
ncbi:MAG TPA: 2Fe-2S iron-sulfur cluster-binding protein [Anaerolineaceae bacterium]